MDDVYRKRKGGLFSPTTATDGEKEQIYTRVLERRTVLVDAPLETLLAARVVRRI